MSQAYHEVNKTWNSIINGKSVKTVKEEVEAYRRQLNIFMPGDYYYYIFDVSTGSFDHVSNDITRVLGYDAKDVDVPFFIDKMHPEDLPFFLAFERKIIEVFKKLPYVQVPNYKVRYDYRVRRSDGEYLRILQQVMTIEHSVENPVLKTFGVHTDISFLRKEGQPELSIIGINGEPSFINLQVEF